MAGVSVRSSGINRTDIGGMTVDQLEYLYRRAKEKYYTTGTPIMSDAVFDYLEQQLKKKKPKSPALKEQWAEKVGRKKVALPNIMNSLNKVRAGEGTLQKWAQRNPGPYCISDKLDGMGLQVVYRNGLPYKLYTGGKDGITGQDVSHLIPHIKGLPKQAKFTGEIGGECVVAHQDFEQWSHKYANARNLAGGIVNKLGAHEAIKEATFVAYKVYKSSSKPSDQLRWLESKKFITPKYKVVKAFSDDALSKYVLSRNKNSPYLLDGICIYSDVPHPAETSGNPTWAIAFKEDSVGNYAETTVIKVEWNASKDGYLIPRIFIEPVKLAGATVNKASAFNAKYILDNKIGPGALISIKRSGEVIPDIQEVLKPAKKAQMPDLPADAYTWTKTNVDLVLVKKHVDPQVQAKRIAEFFTKGLKVTDMGIGVAQTLVAEGYDTMIRVMKMKLSDWEALPRFGKVKAAKIYKQIEAGLQSANPILVMAASGMMGRGMGERRLKPIYDAHPKYFTFGQDHSSRAAQSAIVKNVLALHGYEETTAQLFASGLVKFNTWVAKTPIKFAKVEKVQQTSSALAGQSVCFTGVRDKQLELAITQAGGKIASGVTKNTTILIAADVNEDSIKLNKARDLGIPIYTVAEFKKKYKI